MPHEDLARRVAALERLTRRLGLALVAMTALWFTQCVAAPPTSLVFTAEDGGQVVLDSSGLRLLDASAREVARYGQDVELGGGRLRLSVDGESRVDACGANQHCASLSATGGRARVGASTADGRIAELVADAEAVGVAATAPGVGRARLGARRDSVELTLGADGGYPSAQLSTSDLTLRDAQGKPIPLPVPLR